jgi:glycosyltransferase involved in cell wall biosynthesis
MPVALIEAQLAGVPVIALNAGSIKEVVENRKSGFIFDYLDKDFISTLDNLSKKKLNRLKFGIYGKRRAKKEFGPERLIQDHIELFKKVL